MKYKVKPYIQIDNSVYNNRYDVLITEIMAMSSSELTDVIDGIENVFAGKWLSNSFSGQHMVTVNYDKDIAKINLFDEIVGEEPTIEIYNMLKAYRDKLKDYENASPQI